MTTETSIAERIEKRHEAQRLAAWSALADVLRNKGKRSADDNAAKIAELAGILGVPIGELDEFNRVVREFDNLADADEQAAAAAEALEVASKAIEDHDAETDAILIPLRMALESAQARRSSEREPLAQAATTAKVEADQAQRRKARRLDLSVEHADLLATHEVKARVDAEIAALHEAEREKERQFFQRSAIEAASTGRLVDALPEPIRSKLVDEAARTGHIMRHSADPTVEGTPGPMEVSFGYASRAIEQEVKDRRETLLAQLLRNEITRTEAGPAVIRLGEYRGLIPKDGHRRYVGSHNGQFTGGAA